MSASPAALASAAQAIQPFVDAGELAGAATLIWRKGELVAADAVGWRDVESRTPMSRDSLFRIASSTKPITSVATLILIERSVLRLDDLIVRWLPEFAQMSVLRSPTGPLDDVEPARRPITVEDLLTHRSGLVYGFMSAGPIAEAHLALGAPLDSPLSPDAWIAALAAIPLSCQPGERFCYGHSTDLLGLMLARIMDRPFEDLLAELIFQPLGMGDTGFTVPAAKRDRRAAVYAVDIEHGGLKPAPVRERPPETRFVSGGQGLWSTVDDYLSFARLFLGGGAVDGVRLLKPETLAMMTQNRLTPEQRAGRALSLLGGPPMFTGHGFGLGVSVVIDPARVSRMMGAGRPGAVGWPGAFGSWWVADPAEDMVAVYLMHNAADFASMLSGKGLGPYLAQFAFQQAVYDALAG